jgi:hypothetical protein
VADMAGKRWRFTFRRWLDESAQNQLRQLRDILTTCALGQQKDKPIWIWEAKRSFSVKSMYAHLCRADTQLKIVESQNTTENQDFHVANTTECNSDKR